MGKAHDRKELKAALENAAQFDRKILVEENIDGHEVECAVLGNEDVKAATVGEIMPTVEFYDFDAKYNDNSTELQIPADLPKETIEQIREYAVRAFKALDGSGLSRVDFFVKHSDGSVVLNEINTLPGFTNISMYPCHLQTPLHPYRHKVFPKVQKDLELFRPLRTHREVQGK